MASRQEGNKISRRQALVRGAQITGALAMGGALSGQGLPGVFAAAKKAAEKKVTRLGFTTYMWGKDWDIPTLIANLTKTQLFGVELRTQKDWAQKVEVTMSASERAEVKKQFADSPVKLVGLACGDRFDSPDPDMLKSAIESAKAHMKLSHDVGASGVRVFPNDFQEGVPREVTIAQIAKSLDEVGAYAADYGQQVRLECHGRAGDLQTIRDIMVQVTKPNVRIKLNSSTRDTRGEGFEHNFNLVKEFLGDTLHLHEMQNPDFPYQLQMNLLVKMGWTGWQLLELEKPVEDPIKGLIEYREMWTQMLEKAQAA